MTTAAPLRWVVGGVAAELARRLNASVAVIRVLLVGAVWLEPWVFALYAAAALLLPRGARRAPSWSGLVALTRVGLLILLFAAVSPALPVNAAFTLGPALWLPAAGVAVIGLLVLVSSGPDVEAIDESRARAQVLAALPVAALAVAVLAGIALVEDVRWERPAAAAVIVAGCLVALGRASVPPAALLAAVVVFFAGTGARFEGGIGAARVLPDRGGGVVVRRAAGHVVIDLRRVRTGAVSLNASVGAGELEILVPRHADIRTRLRVGRGTLSVRGRTADGVDLRRAPTGASRTRERIEVAVVAEVGVGELRITRLDTYDRRPGI